MWAISNPNHYLRLCEEAATNEEVFKNFKNHKDYSGIVTGVSKVQGEAYLEKLRKKNSRLLSSASIEKLRRGDEVGKPQTFHMNGIGNIAPVTLRYANVLDDLERNFGDLTNFKIVEIGCGFGDQCRIIRDFFDGIQYTIIDMPQVIKLSSRYIAHLSQTNPCIISCLDVPAQVTCDLVISNYAISELSKDEQDAYIQKVIKNSKRGYITYNTFREFEDKNKPYSFEQFKSIISKIFDVRHYNEKVPKSECEVITWGSNT